MKNIRLIFAFSAILIAFIGCKDFNQKQSNKGTKSIKIGAILPLTGGAAFVGVPIKNAIQLKVDEYNKKALTNVVVVFEDSKADIKEAVSALEKLNSQGIKVILGPVTSGEVLGAAPVAEKNKIVLFSPSASAQNISHAGDYIFRNELSDQQGATIQAQLALNKLKWKKISILYINNDYGVGVKDSFESEFKKLGGSIVTAISFKVGETDFKTPILKIKSQESDAIFIVAQVEYPLIIKQLIENNITSKIYATPIFEDKAFIDQIGNKQSEGIIYTYYGTFSLKTDDSISKSFISKYKSKYNIDPTYYAALGYDNISILIEALKNTGFDVGKAKQGLYSIKNYKGVTGEISFDKNGDVSKPVILKIVKNGIFADYK